MPTTAEWEETDRRTSARTGQWAAQPRLGFVGFGEVTLYLVRGLSSEGMRELVISTRSSGDPAGLERAQGRAAEAGGRIASDFEDLFESCDIVFSSVHGNVSLETARRAAEHIRPGQIFVDLNNAVPSVKRLSAQCIESKGGRFVDVGLLELPIQRGHQALMYASGEAAADFQAALAPFGMNIVVVEGGVGQAAIIKAIANIYMKGLQGVCLEFAISARKAGVPLSILEPLLVKPVLGLPRENDVGFWIIRGALLAGRKRDEMNEAVKMLEDLETDPIMLRATVERLNRVAQMGLGDRFDAAMPVEDYEQIIDHMFATGGKHVH